MLSDAFSQLIWQDFNKYWLSWICDSLSKILPDISAKNVCIFIVIYDGGQKILFEDDTNIPVVCSHSHRSDCSSHTI